LLLLLLADDNPEYQGSGVDHLLLPSKPDETGPDQTSQAARI
jgi:hypothetical protein